MLGKSIAGNLNYFNFFGHAIWLRYILIYLCDVRLNFLLQKLLRHELSLVAILPLNFMNLVTKAEIKCTNNQPGPILLFSITFLRLIARKNEIFVSMSRTLGFEEKFTLDCRILVLLQ